MGKKSKRKSSGGGGAAAAAPPSQPSPSSRRNNVSDDDAAAASRPAPALRQKTVPEEEEETADNLRFQDPYADEFDEDEEDDDYEDVYESSGDEMDEDNAGGEYAESMADGDDGASKKPAPTPAPTPQDSTDAPAVRSWNPFSSEPLPSGTKLEMDETAYKMHHALTPEWPSMALDVIRDGRGANRTRFPHELTLAVGSQADRAENNKLTIFRMSDLGRIPGSGGRSEKELDDEMLGEELDRDEDGGGKDGEEEEDDDDESSIEEEEELDTDPILEHYSFPHRTGGINRLRVCPQNPAIVATWSEAAIVSLYDVGGALDALERSANKGKLSNDSSGNTGGARKMRKEPFFHYSGHSAEGYALDWSPVQAGRLATADCDGNVHIWDATHPVEPSSSSRWGTSSFDVQPTYAAHGDNVNTPSVEDLQWSPTEATVLASAECGGIVRIYDTRCPGKAMISNKIHEDGADVNVLGWNRLVSNLLATGGDNGSFCVWDLRNFQPPKTKAGKPSNKAPEPLARFTSHRTPITSLEWHPTDESMIAVSDDRGTYVYDLSIEEDDPDKVKAAATTQEEEEGVIPPQLLFVHSGSEMTKEIRWHPQIPSCIATTSLSGFSVFIPSNL